MQLPALILTAGLGTRLKPLSVLRAKAALPVACRPLAARVIEWLASHGIRDVVLNLHHRPETLTRAIGDGTDLGVRVRYSWEDPVLGSAGGPRHALPLLEGSRLLIANGDTLTNLDLEAMHAAHARSGALVTMALIPNPRPDQYGGVLVDGDRVTAFTPRQAGAWNYHFIGVQIVEKGVFAALPDNQPAETVGELYPRLMHEAPGSVRAFVSDATFEDIGTPRDYFETSQALGAREGMGDVQLCAGASVAAGAAVSRAILWEGASVGAGASLSGCIVADGVHVPDGTQLVRSIVLPAFAEKMGAMGERRGNLLVSPL